MGRLLVLHRGRRKDTGGGIRLVHNANRRHGAVRDVLLCSCRITIRYGRVDAVGVGIGAVGWVHAGGRSAFGLAGHHGLVGWHAHLPVAVGNLGRRFICRARGVVLIAWRSIILTVWAHTVQLQANTGGARPCVGSGGITLDFASSASLARSHHCTFRCVSLSTPT